MGKPIRLQALDVLRGLLIAAMILVNDPGSWSHVFSPLLHAEWNGFTPTDFIFPGFLFVVGVSIALALQGYTQGKVVDGSLWLKVFRRTAILFGLGLFLNAFPAFDLSTWRIPGVLQRIAITYLFGVIIFLYIPYRGQFLLLLLLLFGYWGLMTQVAVPGVGEANLGPKTNLAAWVDVQVFGKHIWAHSISGDPEGLLSTIPAIATVIIGLLAGRAIRLAQGDVMAAAKDLLLWGIIAIICAWLWSNAFPINKNLWSSSFVLLTGGIGMVVLGWILYLVDGKGWKGWAEPFRHFGLNPIILYFLSGVVASTLYAVPVGETSLHTWIFQHAFQSWLPDKMASLSFAIVFVSLFYVLAWVLYRKKIFIKV